MNHGLTYQDRIILNVRANRKRYATARVHRAIANRKSRLHIENVTSTPQGRDKRQEIVVAIIIISLVSLLAVFI